MSKLIAIWGAPGAGKTTVAVKLASAIGSRYNSLVLTIFADDTTPVLPTLFPTRKSDELYSMGEALSRSDLTMQELEANLITVKNLPNIGFLGYKDGENRFSYPQASESKCRELLSIAQTMADVVIVDCTSVPNTLSKAAMKDADMVFRVVSPDLKSIAFCASQLPILENVAHNDKHLITLNAIRNDIHFPIEDVKHHFGNVSFTVPYSRAICVQTINGSLTDSTADKKYDQILGTIAATLIG